MTGGTTSVPAPDAGAGQQATRLAAHVQLIRAAADLAEQAGIPGLAIYPEPDQIVIQVPETAGDTPSRAAAVARLAAITGGQPGPDPGPGRTQGWIHARGQFAGHPVHIFTPVKEQAAS
jgi:hypothetical protein